MENEIMERVLNDRLSRKLLVLLHGAPKISLKIICAYHLPNEKPEHIRKTLLNLESVGYVTMETGHCTIYKQPGRFYSITYKAPKLKSIKHRKTQEEKDADLQKKIAKLILSKNILPVGAIHKNFRIYGKDAVDAAISAMVSEGKIAMSSDRHPITKKIFYLCRVPVEPLEKEEQIESIALDKCRMYDEKTVTTMQDKVYRVISRNKEISLGILCGKMRSYKKEDVHKAAKELAAIGKVVCIDAIHGRTKTPITKYAMPKKIKGIKK